MRRVIALLAWTALVLTPLVSSAQIGGGGSIQGLVLDTSNLAVPGATVTGDERRDRHQHDGSDDERRSVRAQAAPAGRVSGDRQPRRLSDSHARGDHRRRAGSRGTEHHAPGGGHHAGRRGHGVGAAAGDGRRPARPDHPQRRLHRAAARDEYRRTARSDRVHVPHARRAVDRTLGQRHGRPGFHDRHVRRRHTR